MKRIFIIGNAPGQEAIHSLFHKDDTIIRFNQPSEQCQQAYGNRTDILFSINTWKFVQKRIQANLLENVQLTQCRQIVLPYHPSILQNYHRQPSWFSACFKAKKIDGTVEAIGYFGQKFPVTVLSRNFYLECCQLLKIQEHELKDKVPSTGFMSIMYFLNNFPESTIYIHGFSWEGWDGHEWDTERNVINQLLIEQKISWAKNLLNPPI